MKSKLFFTLSLVIFAASLNAQVDYRYCQSPVRDQLYRGTCTAFSVVAAMETFAGVPTDLSEQYIFAQVKSKQIVDEKNITPGSFLKHYQSVINLSGTLREDEMPYNGNSVLWSADEEAFEKFKKEIAGASLYKLLQFPDYTYSLKNNLCQYLDETNANDVAAIKNKLDSGIRAIPVSYVIPSQYWSSFMEKGYAVISLNDMIKIKTTDGTDYISYDEAKKEDNNLLEKILTAQRENVFRDSMYIPDGGHAVCIVGYTDKGFIIKNSWSEAWGEKGYGIITFDYHRIFCKEALIIKAITMKVYAEKETTPFDQKMVDLKVIPHDLFGTQTIEFSLIYKGTGKPPVYDKVSYRVYLESAGEKNIEVEKGSALAYTFNYEYGYSKYMLTGFDFTKVAAANKSVCVDVTFKNTADGKTYTNVYKNVSDKNMELFPSENKVNLNSLHLK